VDPRNEGKRMSKAGRKEGEMGLLETKRDVFCWNLSKLKLEEIN